MRAAKERVVACILAALITTSARGETIVSNLAYGGIPVGSDTTGRGTAAAPFKTIDKGYAEVPSGGTILLNGNPASPSAYPSTGGLQIRKPLKIDSVVAGGATIPWTSGAAVVVEVAPPAGGTVTFGCVKLDGENKAASVIATLDEATLYSVVVETCTVLANPTFAAISGGTKTRIDLSFGGRILAKSLAASIDYPYLVAGSIKIDGASATIAGRLPDYGMFAMVNGVSPSGTKVAISNVTVSASAIAGGKGAYEVIRVQGVPGPSVTNSTIAVTDSGAGLECEIILFGYKAGSNLPANGALVNGNTLTHDCAGFSGEHAGHHIEIGSDGDPGVANRAMVNNAVLTNNTLIGTAGSISGAVEPVFIGYQDSGLAALNHCDLTAYCVLFKGVTGDPVAYGNVATRGTLAGMVQRAGTGVWSHNTISSTTAAQCFQILDDEYGAHARVTLLDHNLCDMEGNFAQFILSPPGETLVLATDDDYYTPGPIPPGAWTFGNKVCSTLSCWQTIEPTAFSKAPSGGSAAAR